MTTTQDGKAPSRFEQKFADALKGRVGSVDEGITEHELDRKIRDAAHQADLDRRRRSRANLLGIGLAVGIAVSMACLIMTATTGSLVAIVAAVVGITAAFLAGLAAAASIE